MIQCENKQIKQFSTDLIKFDFAYYLFNIILLHKSHSHSFFSCCLNVICLASAILNHFHIVCQSMNCCCGFFKIVVKFSLVASPIDVVALVVTMDPMVSMTRTFLLKAAHFRLELATLPLDHNQSLSQFQLDLVSMH